MEHRIYNEAKQHLLHTCNLLAPTGEVQCAFANLVHEMETDRDFNLGYEDVLKRLMWALLDGLQYGNWPR